jgi:Domain of unknown function (DUF4351)
VRLGFIKMSSRKDLSKDLSKDSGKVYREKSLAEPTGGNLVLRRLERRCGLLGVDRQALVRSLTITQLEFLGDALLDFNKDGGSRGLVRGKFMSC